MVMVEIQVRVEVYAVGIEGSSGESGLDGDSGVSKFPRVVSERQTKLEPFRTLRTSHPTSHRRPKSVRSIISDTVGDLTRYEHEDFLPVFRDCYAFDAKRDVISLTIPLSETSSRMGEHRRTTVWTP